MNQPHTTDADQVQTIAEANLTAHVQDRAAVDRIRRLARLVSLDLGIDRLASMALRELSGAVQCRRCSMLLLNGGSGDILIESQERPEGDDGLRRIVTNDEIPTFLVPARGNVTKHILRTRRPLLVQNAPHETRFGGGPARAYPARAFVSAPLTMDGRVRAILNATGKEGDQPISDNDLSVIEVFATQLALKLHMRVGDVEDLFRRAHGQAQLRAERDQLKSKLAETARLAQRRKAQLSTVHVLAELLQTDFVLEELAKMIVNLVSESADATKVSVLIIDDKKGDLLTRGAADSDQVVTQRLPHRGGVTEKVLREKSSLLVEGNQGESIREGGPYQTDSYVVVPVFRGRNIEAIICATDKRDGSSFDKEDLRFLEAIAAQVAVTLNDFRMRERILRQRTLERELRIAGEIQENLFPVALPTPEPAEFAAQSRPAGFVGGDYYDVFDLGDERYEIVIADVSGKGIPAALVMVMISTFLRTLGPSRRSTGEIVAELNRYLETHIEKNMYATMGYALFDAKDRTLSYTNAGHCYPLLLRKDAQGPVELTQNAFPLAVFPDVEFETTQISLEPGDVFMMFTDGLTDARNAQDEQFGKQTVIDGLIRHRDRTADGIVGGLMAQVQKFSEGTEPFDDTTVIALRIAEDQG